MGLTQNFPRPVQEAIRERISVRGYEHREIPHEIISQVNSFMLRIPNLFDTQIRLEIMQISSLEKDEFLKLGSYSVIRGTNTFLVAGMAKVKMNLVNAGYVMEQVVLFAQALGLGSCWLASTFNREAFIKAMQLQGNEVMPVIISLGYPQKGMDMIGGIFRTFANSRTRKAWKDLFYQNDFSTPLTKESADPYTEALEMVRMSPSAVNHQPWRIVRQANQFHFYIFRKILPENKRKLGSGC
jgi:nitroreductase